MPEAYDFSGWATRNNLKCADGRTILQDAFKDDDGKIVPIVWNHNHEDPYSVLGHALLQNRPEGVYAYGKFNDSEQGQASKILVKNGDITALSIYANHLKHNSSRGVMHGEIKELSLVLAGANPGATIDCVMTHGETDEDEIFVISDGGLSFGDSFAHADEAPASEAKEEKKEEPKVAESKERTVNDVIESMTEEQKKVLYFLVAEAEKLGAQSGSEKEKENKSSEGGDNMKHNDFENESSNDTEVLRHDDTSVLEAIADAKRYGSMKDSFLQHGIENIEYLFPEAKNLNNPPEWMRRPDDWVKFVMNNVAHTPFSRIKSMYADITEPEARAKGYITGHYKKEEFFAVLKRTTGPTTIYKKQKLDRDNVVDITDFDVIAWIKGEMRYMLDEEIARAILIGDGRDISSDEKIDEQCIRPIWTDHDVYTIKKTVTVAANATEDVRAKAFIRAAVKSRKDYKGTGNPVMFMSEDMLTDCLLMEDSMGRVIYDTVDKLKTALRVREIVTVPQFESLSRSADGKTYFLLGLYTNLKDYNVGADKGGAVNMFDDFDIDYNKMIYLIETRCSGALVKPKSAVAIELAFENGLLVMPEDGDTEVFDKVVSTFQSGVYVNDDNIQGNLKYVTGWTQYSPGDVERQSGYYLALKFEAAAGSTTTVELVGGYDGPVALDSDMNAVFRITNKNSQKIRVVSTATDGSVVTKTFGLKSLNFIEA